MHTAAKIGMTLFACTPLALAVYGFIHFDRQVMPLLEAGNDGAAIYAAAMSIVMMGVSGLCAFIAALAAREFWA